MHPDDVTTSHHPEGCACGSELCGGCIWTRTVTAGSRGAAQVERLRLIAQYEQSKRERERAGVNSVNGAEILIVAQSGNACRVTIVAIDEKAAASCAWVCDPTAADMEEVNRAVMDALAKLTENEYICDKTAKYESEDAQHAAVRDYLGGGRG